IIAILSKFGISLTAAAIPATVVSAAVGFGAQGVIADFLGGLFIIAEKQYGIGDWVEFHAPSGTVQGDVVNMTLRATTIRTLNGEEIIVP
nr:mechanosensitive ion channel [Escherichia coli]